jgi:cytochrome P450
MSPPVSSTPWRQLAPDAEGVLVIDGHQIPKGIAVGVNIYSLHHTEEYFPDPFKFSPERWLASGNGTEPSAEQRRTREAFCPFSIGHRSCAGKPVAYLEASLTLAKTLWYLDFERATGALGQVGAGKKGGQSGRERPEEFQLYDTFNSVHDGPYLVFKPRNSSFWEELGVNEP